MIQLLQILLLFFLGAQVKSQGGAIPKNVSQVRYGRVNVKDRIAYDLDNIFGSKKGEWFDKYFQVNNKASRVITNDPFTIREFREDCNYFNKGHEYSEIKTFTMICDKNKLFEVAVNKDGQIMASPNGFQQLAEFIDPSVGKLPLTCFNQAYYPQESVYAVICETPERGIIRGDVIIFLVSRTNNEDMKVTGEITSLVREPKSGNIQFSEKRTVKLVKFNKGNALSSDMQFIVYDEPYLFTGHQTPSKDNIFFILLSIQTKNGKKIFDRDLGDKESRPNLVDFAESRKGVNVPKIAEFADLIRVISIATVHDMLIISGHFDGSSNRVDTLKCRIETTNSKFVIGACVFIKTRQSTDLAYVDFFQSYKDERIKKVATYMGRTKVIRLCDLNILANYEDKQESYEENCAEIKTRALHVMDIAFSNFDSCDNEDTCDGIWFDELKKNYVGIDRMKKQRKADQSSSDKFEIKLMHSFYCYGNSGRMIGEKMYMAEEKFISGFDESRSQEVLITSNLLPPGEDFYVTLYKHQANTHEFINITGYRIKQMVYQVSTKQQFPKFRGSLDEYYHVPLGRDYFNGNAVDFKLQANPDIEKDSHVHYVLPAKFYVDGESSDHKVFFNGFRSSIVLTSTNKLYALRCTKNLEKGFISMKCIKITKQDKGQFSFVQIEAGEIIIGHYETQSMHFVATNKGRIFAYDRTTLEFQAALRLGTSTSKFDEVTWTSFSRHVLVAMLDKTRKEILSGKLGMFNLNNSGSLSEIKKYEDKKGSQETPGEFCPTSIEFSHSFDSQLVVVNSCKPPKQGESGTDRRIITYAFTPDGSKIQETPGQNKMGVKNEFIRLRDLNGDNLSVCTDKEMIFVANIGTRFAFGIGISTNNMIEDLGLDELNVAVIHKMICLGHKAMGLVYTDTSGRLTVMTYMLSKMRDSDNRVHSFFHLQGTFVDIIASESQNLVIYNIQLKEEPNARIMALILDGPSLYIKSKDREIAYETQIEIRNKFEGNKYDMMIEFEKLVKTAGISHREISPVIEPKEYVDVEKFTLQHGPIWKITYGGTAGIILEGRVSGEKIFQEVNVENFELVSIDAVEYVDDKVFMLAQTRSNTVIVVRDDMPKPGASSKVIDLKRICKGLRVAMNHMDAIPNGYLFLTNCFITETGNSISDGSRPRLAYMRLTKLQLENPSVNVIDAIKEKMVFNKGKDFPSSMFDLAFLKEGNTPTPTPTRRLEKGEYEPGVIPYRHRLLQGQGKEIVICFIHQQNRTMFMNYLIHGEQSGQNLFEFHELYRDENGNEVYFCIPNPHSTQDQIA